MTGTRAAHTEPDLGEARVTGGRREPGEGERYEVPVDPAEERQCDACQ